MYLRRWVMWTGLFLIVIFQLVPAAVMGAIKLMALF